MCVMGGRMYETRDKEEMVPRSCTQVQCSPSRAACRTRLGWGRGAEGGAVTEAMVRDGQGRKPGSAHRNVCLSWGLNCLVLVT